jgi:hypothetical protein
LGDARRLQNGAEITAMRQSCLLAIVGLVAWSCHLTSGRAAEPEGTQAVVDFASLPTNAWVKLSPVEGAPPSPRLGYEGACVWDSKHERLIRYGGHNQGGGGEQHSEVWSFDPRTARWEFKQPNVSPPGVCCAQQNVFDPVAGRYVRFSAASGGHGWQWFREIYLNDSSVWTYDLATNTWRDMRPFPTAHPRMLRCASWDAEHQVIVTFGGEGSHEGTWMYDAWLNEWHRKSPPLEPAARSGGNMAYDRRNRVHVLFGSQFDDDAHTWLYDLNTNRWRDAQPSTMPPTDKNDAVLTYDESAAGVVAIIKISTGKDEQEVHRLETWRYDVAKNEWTKLDPPAEPDATSNRARQLLFAPQLGVCLLENRPNEPAEQQIWAYRLPAAGKSETLKPSTGTSVSTIRKEPRIVEDLVVSVIEPTKVELTWPANAEAAGYIVERAVVEVLSEDQLKRLKETTVPLESPSVGGIRRVGAFRQITPQPIRETHYVDSSIDLAKRSVVDGDAVEERTWHEEQVDSAGREYRYGVYAYRVRAVDSAGVLSGASPARFTIPSSPQFVFSQEDGTSCKLKWQANAEKGISGYRVYRMDGRYHKDPISRLTTMPLHTLNYVDSAAGKPTRRYYIVAVDAIGQEGQPSSPVWFNRDWQEYYEPFVDDWH